jgi:hypothetical protein
MSVEFILIPLGIALVAAWREARSNDLCEKCRATAITNQRLLVDALHELDATDLVEEDDRVTATTAFGPVTFQKVGDVFLGRVDTASEEATATMLTGLQGAVGMVLQQRSAERLRARASELGLRLIEDRAADGEIRLVFEEVR